MKAGNEVLDLELYYQTASSDQQVILKICKAKCKYEGPSANFQKHTLESATLTKNVNLLNHNHQGSLMWGHFGFVEEAYILHVVTNWKVYDEQ